MNNFVDQINITVITSIYCGEKYLKGFFANLLEIVNLDEIEVLLIHNEPKKEETEIIQSYLNHEKLKRCLKYIIINERESLYKSWNRGIQLSTGKYLTTWNIDDIRSPNSLYEEKITLEANNNAYLTYGDIIGVEEYHSKEGEYFRESSFKGNKKPFLRNYYGNCFFMWKKEVHNKIGYFDEQLKSAGDYDFWIRVVRAFEPVKTNLLLGYYLMNTGISSTGKINDIERAFVLIRYGIFDKLYLPRSYYPLVKYKILTIRSFEKDYSIKELFDDYYKYLLIRTPLIIIGILSLPLFYFFYPLAHVLKRIMNVGISEAFRFYRNRRIVNLENSRDYSSLKNLK